MDKPQNELGLIWEAIYKHPQLSWEEKNAVIKAIQAGSDFGFGNVMGWLATAWAVILRDRDGLPEEAAIDFVSNRGPYSLPKKP